MLKPPVPCLSLLPKKIASKKVVLPSGIIDDGHLRRRGDGGKLGELGNLTELVGNPHSLTVTFSPEKLRRKTQKGKEAYFSWAKMLKVQEWLGGFFSVLFAGCFIHCEFMAFFGGVVIFQDASHITTRIMLKLSRL